MRYAVYCVLTFTVTAVLPVYTYYSVVLDVIKNKKSIKTSYSHSNNKNNGMHYSTIILLHNRDFISKQAPHHIQMRRSKIYDSCNKYKHSTLTNQSTIQAVKRIHKITS